MNLKVFVLGAVFVPGVLMGAPVMAESDGPKIVLQFDEKLIDEGFTKGNAAKKLENLKFAILEGRGDILDKIDAKPVKITDEDKQVVADLVKKMNPFVRAGIVAALETRGDKNKNMLKTLLEVLKKDESPPELVIALDRSASGKDITEDNVGAHITDLSYALIKGDKDILARIDSDKKRLGEEEIIIIREYLTTVPDTAVAALKGALEARGQSNKNALKQILEIINMQI